MFARIVTAQMYPDKFDLATRKFEEKVIPLLRKQRGFRDEVSFFDKKHNETVAISFWDTEADELKYEKDVYPELMKDLSDTIDGKPEVKHFEVANSTWYKIHAG
jgi:heme-degrading monooxygenase HmoA